MLLGDERADSAEAGTKATGRYEIAQAAEEDRAAIAAIRHQVYASELGQHAENGRGAISDDLDRYNVYLVGRMRDEVVGFVSITPPADVATGRPNALSIDKYVSRDRLPIRVDRRTFEVRILTVLPRHRRSSLASLLMYAALRWVEERGGRRIIAIGRADLAGFYRSVGLKPTGLFVQSGRVRFEVMWAGVERMRRAVARRESVLTRLLRRSDWRLNFPRRRPRACFHGGASIGAIGERFDDLGRASAVINADVLDAWFDPAPGVIAALREHLPWIIRTSPPTGCEGLTSRIAEARGVDPRSILAGAGSSDLIFLAMRRWLRRRSRVLLPEPTYGEYAHVFRHVIGCRVDRLRLRRPELYDIDADRLAATLRDRYDLVVLVNPNSPTGRHMPRSRLERLIRAAPSSTRFWIDETYIDYVGEEQSLESFAADDDRVMVCKSMSKVYALSGVRAAYLCGSPDAIDALRPFNPPWAVGLPGQIAAVRALEDPAYYRACRDRTHALRRSLEIELRDRLGVEVIPSVANFLLFHLASHHPSAASVIARCRERGLFLRDASGMGRSLGGRAIRIAVKDEPTNRRMVEILRSVLDASMPV